MRYAVALIVLLASPLAASNARADEPDAWTDFTTQSQSLENTSSQDCATACKALESLARAAQHICDVAPEHCEEAKSRLRAASDRVHAACPQCNVAAHGDATPPVVDAKTTNVAAAESTRGGGCAGCTTASTTPADAGVMTLALAAIVGLVRTRKKKTRRV